MSRLTGNDAKSLMEAYNNVYAPQELTEEQVWEEVENWVNSLLEEGYDLSDYTWEEMYESYLNEISIRDVTAGARQNLNRAASTVSDIAGSGLRGYAGKTTTSTNPISRTFNAATRGVRDAAAGFVTGRGSTPEAKPERQGPYVPERLKKEPLDPGRFDREKARLRNVGNPTGGNKPAAGSAPAAKVSPTKPAEPAKPATGMLGKTSFERRTPTSAELKAAQAARASGASPEKALQAAKSASAPKVAPSNTLSSTVAAASKPAAFSPAPEVKASNTIAATPKPAPVSPRQQRLNMEMEYDAYDLVLEYLLSEGHVETVEEAHYVMMEMDAEMIGTIVEAAADQSDKQIDKGVKTTYKAQNVLDNQHQGRSKGLNKLPRGEREEKAKRMQGRLKARRDDLFGERNKREDSKREQLKKMLGL
jgi:hypothetical protein